MKDKEERKPIYEMIQENLKDGRLPEDFALEDEWQKAGELSWAPGAHDGVMLNHMAPYEANEEEKGKILEILSMISEGENADNMDRIFGILEELDKKNTIVRMYDAFRESIGVNQDKLNLMNIVNFGDWLICRGASFLAVKFGLTLLSGFSIPFVEEVHITFGAYEEFTYYAARCLSSRMWEDGNEQLFRLARNLRGWGRVHAVEYLRPETEEIRDWLLFEGSDNTVVPQYSSEICLWKGGAVPRLRTGASAKEFEAIGRLIGECLESGPCPGLSDPEPLLAGYLGAAKGRTFDRELIQTIRDWAEENELNQEIVSAAEKLLG